MNEKHGTQYIIIPVGDVSLRCEDEDADGVLEMIEKLTPFKGDVLRGSAADRMTVQLLRDKGRLP
jgi:hypothetical protein